MPITVIRGLKTLACWLMICCFQLYADDRTAIADASESLEVRRVTELIAGGADVNAPQPDGTTALHWATHHENADLVKQLLAAKADADAKNQFGITPLHMACMVGNAAIGVALLEAGADANLPLAGGQSPLMTASRTGSVELVQALLQRGASIDTRDQRGQNALMWASAEGHLAVVKLLVEHGAKVDESLPSGFSPLFFAVRAGRQPVVDFLINHGAAIDQTLERVGGIKPARKGTSPLMLAVENGHFELAVFLLEKGANPNDDRSGFTALHALSWVRKPNRGDGDDGDPAPGGSGRMDSLQFARQLHRFGADVNFALTRGDSGRGKVTRRGATPLFMAAITADLPLIKLLVELGADPLRPNAEGTTPLMVAAGLGNLAPGEEAGTEQEVLETLDFLLALGADINTVDSRGETAMHGAAYKNLPLVIAYLHAHGADISLWNRPNQIGWTPLSIASGTRVGNFKPSPPTMAALHSIYQTTGIEPATPTATSLDIYQTPPSPVKRQDRKVNLVGNSAGNQNEPQALAEVLKRIVAEQQASWNEGNIPKFMDAYWRDDQLTFSAGGKVERGWAAIRDRYLRRYPDKATMGQLEFTDLEVQSLGEDVALMLGRWKLQREKPAAGAFSLVWKRIDGQWKIIHDHSSSDQ